MKKTLFLTALVALGLGAAQASDIVGYVSRTINAGSQSTFSVVFDKAPPASFNGTTAGVITAVGTNTTTSSGAAWDTNFSTTANPYYMKITSGAWEGRIYRILSNTADTLTLTAPTEYPAFGSGANITVSTDTFEIVQGETLSSYFNPLGVYQNSTAATSDNVLLNSTGSYTTYFRSSTTGNWTTGTPTNQNNTRIEPWSGYIYVRRAAAGSAITLLTSGDVPTEDAVTFVENSGATLFGSAFPVNGTIGGLALQNLPGWVKNTTFATADKLYINTTGSWNGYFFNNSTNNWKNSSNSPTNQSVTVIPAGTPILIGKLGNATGSVEYIRLNTL